MFSELQNFRISLTWEVLLGNKMNGASLDFGAEYCYCQSMVNPSWKLSSLYSRILEAPTIDSKELYIPYFDVDVNLVLEVENFLRMFIFYFLIVCAQHFSFVRFL